MFNSQLKYIYLVTSSCPLDLQTDWVAMNYVPFAEKSLEFTADLYKSTARHPVVMEEHVLQNILRVSEVSDEKNHPDK